MNKEAISACFEKCDNFYLYDENITTANANRLKKNFPQVDFLYFLKRTGEII